MFDAVKFTTLLLLLQLSDTYVSILSCFENSRRHYYRDRIRAWNWVVKIITPLFFFAFLLLIAVAAWQEPWYTGPGMCYSRCHNHTDCQERQTLGLVKVDNRLGRFANIWELKNREQIGTPPCPGAGALVIPDVNDSTSCGCAWLAHEFHVSVLQPEAHVLSDNSTYCTAAVLLVTSDLSIRDSHRPPAIGTAVPAMWQSMTDGRNDNSSQQLEVRVTGHTNISGYAHFTSPLHRPFNGSSSHGCNLTVLASEANFTINRGNSTLTNNVSWGCINCKGEWVTAAPCNAMCESAGNTTKTYHVLVRENDCGAGCEAPEGKNIH